MMGVQYMVRIIIAEHRLFSSVSVDDITQVVNDKLKAAYWYVRWVLIIASLLFWYWPQSPHRKFHYCKTSRWMALVNFIRFYETWILMYAYDGANL